MPGMRIWGRYNVAVCAAIYLIYVFLVQRLKPSKEELLRIHTKARKDGDVLLMEPPSYLHNYKNPCWYEGAGQTLKLRCLPYFQLIGVDKCGTTDLFYRLLGHPEILPSTGFNQKESHWWSWRRFGYNVFHDDREVMTMDQYLDLFDEPAAGIAAHTANIGHIAKYHPLITGEGSPTVFWDFTGWKKIPQNAGLNEPAVLTPHCIKHLQKDAKFILLLRNPTERLYSDYLFLNRDGKSKENFHKRVTDAQKMIQDCAAVHSTKQCLYNKTLHMRIPTRLQIGTYDVYLQEWFDVFPRKNFLILRSEDYSNDIEGHLKTAYKFLGLKPLNSTEMNKVLYLGRSFTRGGSDKDLGPMLPETKQLLDQFYGEHNQRLAGMLGDTKYLWKD